MAPPPSRPLTIRFPLALALFIITAIRGGRLLLALFALQMGAQPATVGLIAATFSALPMLLSIHVGQVSDRLGTRWPLLLGTAGCCVGITVPFFFQSIPALFVAAFLNGLSYTFYSVCLQHVIGQLSAPQQRTANYANFTLMASLGTLIAPLVVGFLVDGIGHALTCLVVAAISSVPVFMLLLRGHRLPGPGTAHARKEHGRLLDVVGDPQVRGVLIINSLHQSGTELFTFYMPVYTHGIGLSASAIGIIMALCSGAGFLVRIGMKWLLRRLSAQAVLTIALLTGAAVYALVPFTTSVVLLGALAFAFGFAMNVGQPIILSLSYSNAPAGRSGEILGIRQAVTHATRTAVPMAFGWLGQLATMAVFLSSAALLLVGAGVARRGNLGELDK